MKNRNRVLSIKYVKSRIEEVENSKCSEYVYTICEYANPCSLHVMLYRTQKKKKEKETHLNEKAKRRMEIPESEFVEDKELVPVTFIATKNMKAKVPGATKINFNDKKEDGVIPEKKAGKVRAAKEPKASMACKVCASAYNQFCRN